MTQWMYNALLDLANGHEVCFNELREQRQMSMVTAWLDENKIKSNVRVVGFGNRVDYYLKIDGRSRTRLIKLLSGQSIE